MLPDVPAVRTLDTLAELGFDGAEICLEHPHLNPGNLTEDVARSMADRAGELGMEPNSVSYHKDFVYDDRLLEETIRAIRLTPAFGAKVFVFAGALPRPDDPDPFERMVQRTRRLAAAADDCGVILAEEFEPGFIVGNTDSLHRLLHEVDALHLQANVDIGHVFLCDPDPLAAISSLAGKIAHGHVENMAGGVHRHLPPWEGDMDLPAYLRAMAATGFDGPVALDLYDQPYRQVSPRAIEFLRNAMPA
jgi:sugar phosphate isomerase/epimerase